MLLFGFHWKELVLERLKGDELAVRALRAVFWAVVLVVSVRVLRWL